MIDDPDVIYRKYEQGDQTFLSKWHTNGMREFTIELGEDIGFTFLQHPNGDKCLAASCGGHISDVCKVMVHDSEMVSEVSGASNIVASRS